VNTQVLVQQVATTHIVGTQATFEWCSTGPMELLVVQKLALAIAHIWTPNTLIPLAWGCINTEVLLSSLLENKIKTIHLQEAPTGKIHQACKIQFMSSKLSN
jgi:hypothetical protein